MAIFVPVKQEVFGHGMWSPLYPVPPSSGRCSIELLSHDHLRDNETTSEIVEDELVVRRAAAYQYQTGHRQSPWLI
jgi:hypothetical protein